MKRQWSESSAGITFFAAALLAASMAVAVSCAGLGEDCQFDSDCSGASLCVEQVCYASCSDAEDCSATYDRCQAYTRDSRDGEETVKVCVDESFDAGNNGVGVCEPGVDEPTADCCATNEQCVEIFGDARAVCGIDDRCLIPVDRHAILIRDRTLVDTAIEPADGGLGADIAAVFVRPTDLEAPVGYGFRLDYAPANGADGPDGVLDGQAPTLVGSGQCVDGTLPDDTLPLGGQGGHLLVGLRGPDGSRVQLNNGWKLVVIEWGATCGAPAGEDVYEVFFCSSGQGGIDPETDCSRSLTPQGPVSGYQTLTIDTSD